MRRVVRFAALALAALLAVPFVVAAEKDANWRELKREAKRQEIDAMAEETLTQLRDSNEKAGELLVKAYGYAVFDNLKFAFGISGGGGSGVAVERKSGDRTYMKMGTVGIGLGLGGKRYQVVFVFQDERTFRGFVDRGWQADAQGSAVAGTEGVAGHTGFVNGLAIFQITDTGLMAHADVAGTKYWKAKKLN